MLRLAIPSSYPVRRELIQAVWQQYRLSPVQIVSLPCWRPDRNPVKQRQIQLPAWVAAVSLSVLDCLSRSSQSQQTSSDLDRVVFGGNGPGMAYQGLDPARTVRSAYIHRNMVVNAVSRASAIAKTNKDRLITDPHGTMVVSWCNNVPGVSSRLFPSATDISLTDNSGHSQNSLLNVGQLLLFRLHEFINLCDVVIR